MPFVPNFVKADDLPTGKRAECVAGMIKLMIEEAPDPVTWADLCDHVGMQHQGQLMPAMHALEFVGAVERFTYVEPGGKKRKTAFKISDEVEIIRGDES
jgi:hypothetical protein